MLFSACSNFWKSLSCESKVPHALLWDGIPINEATLLPRGGTLRLVLYPLRGGARRSARRPAESRPESANQDAQSSIARVPNECKKLADLPLPSVSMSDEDFLKAVENPAWHCIAEDTHHFRAFMKPILHKLSCISFEGYDRVLNILVDLLGEDFAASLGEETEASDEAALKRDLHHSCLLIKEVWLEQILDGSKTWEIRGNPCKMRGKRVPLAQSKSGHLMGEATVVDCLEVGVLKDEAIVPVPGHEDSYIWKAEHFDKHRIEDPELVTYPKVFAWVLENPVRYLQPIPYKHKQGCVKWNPLLEVHGAPPPKRLSSPQPSEPGSDESAEQFWNNLEDDFIHDTDALSPDWSLPGMILPHMQVAPSHLSMIEKKSGRHERAHLSVPPDGKCMIYAWLAAKAPEVWSKIPRHPSGFIEDIAVERLLADEARHHLATICSRAREAGQEQVAQNLENNVHPGDEELAEYVKYFGCSFLIIPVGQPHAVPMLHGHGPLGFVVQHSMSKPDENNKQSGHFELLHSWIGQDHSDIEGLEDTIAQILPPSFLDIASSTT